MPYYFGRLALSPLLPHLFIGFVYHIGCWHGQPILQMQLPIKNVLAVLALTQHYYLKDKN